MEDRLNTENKKATGNARKKNNFSVYTLFFRLIDAA
jgi:hypothetical protein